MDNDKNKKIILVLGILTVIFTIIGGSLAYFSWISSEAQKTNIVFTVERTFSCAADGGGSITNNSAIIVPTLVNSNTTGNYIKREVKVTPTINESGKTIYMDLWLDINKLDSGLSNSTHFNYAFTATDSYPTEDTRSGNFNGLTVGDKVMLLDSKTFGASDTSTYYLWIWLDAEETSSDTMDQTFNLSLNGSCTDAIPVEPNAPDLDDGMIPIVISNNGVVTTVSKDDTNWYNYKKKHWANVVLVNSSSRSKYLNTSGVTVNEDDILAYYVWIPRYKYEIWSIDDENKKGQEQEINIVFENKNDIANIPNISFSCASLENPTEDDYPDCYGAPYSVTAEEKQKLITWFHSVILAEMNTSYTLEQATTDVNNILSNGSALIQGSSEDAEEISMEMLFSVYNENNTEQITPVATFIEANEFKYYPGSYVTHPAFWWDNNSDGVLEQSEILNGIWVGKFETTGSANTPTIKPNISSFINMAVSTQFSTAQKLGTSTYGSTSKVDAHMMKNSEWGAVAYLSHSKYGISEEIRINNYLDNNDWSNPKILTGCGASTINGYMSTTCEISYGEAAEYPQSTTGNISGIFGMSGGASEHVMGVFANSNGTLWSGNSTSNNSRFTGLLGSSGTSYTGVAFPDSKYYDIYKAADDDSINVLTACNGGICYGHALSETVNWYSDSANFISTDFPWLARGGTPASSDSSGAFSFSATGGDGFGNMAGFRSVISFVGA